MPLAYLVNRTFAQQGGVVTIFSHFGSSSRASDSGRRRHSRSPSYASRLTRYHMHRVLLSNIASVLAAGIPTAILLIDILLAIVRPPLHQRILLHSLRAASRTA